MVSISHIHLCISPLVTELLLPDDYASCQHKGLSYCMQALTLSSVSSDANAHTLIPTHSLHHGIFPFRFSWQSLGTLVPLPRNYEFLSWSPSLFPQSLFSTPGLFTSQWEAKRYAGCSVGWGRKSAKALAESSRTGVETGIGKRKKWCWRGAAGGLYASVAAYDEGRAGSGPKAKSPLHYSFEIPVL